MKLEIRREYVGRQNNKKVVINEINNNRVTFSEINYPRRTFTKSIRDFVIKYREA